MWARRLGMMVRNASYRSNSTPRNLPKTKRFASGGHVDKRPEATLFNETSETTWEGWEPIVYSAYVGAALVLFVGMANRPNTSIQDWAREEALARLKRYDNGLPVKFGVHYSQSDAALPNFTKEEIGALPEFTQLEDEE